ncbi:MAG: undecaprenyl/decaprenyl-phosphate alpha-N-acetylglucosaminyl 1-phosphate transferase [Acidimicrobiia bacterium]|nr:undecaprenyl/decaprenyl-phosphate alpha-N-acetylglucosaminyl 1-phosphate transferase [Acidimicrobiia bacterium]
MGGTAFVGVVALVPVCRRFALRHGLTDRPSAGKVHSRVTPYLGGVAILLTALAVSSFLPRWSAQGVGILVGAVAVGLVGLVDDVRALGPRPRLAMEAGAATLAFLTGARVHLIGDLGDWALTVTWLVVLTNSFNLLDNMDGAAAVVASVTAVALTVAAALGGQTLVAGLAVTVAGCSVGFLVYNWHPARIFMGDAGSLFLGFLLAALALKLRFSTGHVSGLVAVVFLAGPALFDTTLVVLSRVRHRRPIYIGGTDHTSHRLMRRGLPAPAVAGLLAVVTALSTALGVLVGHGSVQPLVLVPCTAAGAVLLGVLLKEPADAATVVPSALGARRAAAMQSAD